MSTLSLNLPQSLHEQVEALAQKEGISVNQFIALAVAEKLATLATADYLAERAKRGRLAWAAETSSWRCLQKPRMWSLKNMTSCKSVRWKGSLSTSTLKGTRLNRCTDREAEIVGLYLNPSEKPLVICVDEKPSIQALGPDGFLGGLGEEVKATFLPDRTNLQSVSVASHPPSLP